MAKFKNPILFSTHFKIDPAELEKAGLIDPFINVDTQLFIDPVLLAKSSHDLISTQALASFKEHFRNFVRLLMISKSRGDAAWKGAAKLLDLREPPQNGLGFGSTSRSGNSRPKDIKAAILKTSKEIIDLGTTDPEMISLMGFFEEGVGPDTISDFTTRVISKELSQLTQEFCKDHKIRTRKQTETDDFELPSFLDSRGARRFCVLVPDDIVKDLPIANDWAEVSAAAAANSEIRDRVNYLLGGIASPTVADRKAALRRAALTSPATFSAFLDAVRSAAEHYDPQADPLAYYRLKALLNQNREQFKTDKNYDFSSGLSAVLELVRDTILMFKHHVENGNLWETLWVGDKPKKERAAQLIYYAMADCYCKANNIDISPEANMGGGPVDFKFSIGYRGRVLVELKRSSGTVVHGYQKQLEKYKAAARTFSGFFVVMDYGDLGDKLRRIQQLQGTRKSADEPASEIIVIDATKKKSASRTR